MQRLNIPLHRNQHTTRLSRRVVSLVGFVVAAGCVALALASTAWYGRDTTSASAPEGTRLVLHISPNRLTWDDTERVFGNIPLLSDRPLTVSDIRPFTRGEFSVFVGEDGTRSIAVRANKRDVPTKSFDALGIFAQETSRGVFLLSSKPMARMGWTPGHVWLGFIHWPNAAHIGSVHFIEEETVRGSLFVTGKRVIVRIPKQPLSEIPWKSVPSNTISALATPALPNTSVASVTEAIDTILSSYDTPSAAWLSERLLTMPGEILLAKSDESLDFLFAASSDDFDKNQQQKIIQTAVAMENPQIQQITLPDGTRAQEIIVDPTLTTIEETTVAGTLVSRAATSNGRYLYTAERPGYFAVTSSQSLLEHWLKNSKINKESASCLGNAAYLDLRGLLDRSASSLSARSTNILRVIADEYAAMSIQQNWFSTTIRICF